ncbi:hypothetical protein DFH06DRAFT_1021919, partial [Mycena polygramma]
PAGAPKWLTAAVKNISIDPLGPNYMSVLQAVIRVEEAYGFNTTARPLSTVKRPEVIFDWVRGGRGSKSSKPPVIKKFPTYPGVWQGWWDLLQPEWRRRGVNGQWMVGEYGQDWGLLECGGVNGVLNLAASLYYWGRHVYGARETQGEEWFAVNVKLWDDAVHDVAWMLDGLHAYLKT